MTRWVGVSDEGVEVSFDNLACLEVDDDHIFRPHSVVAHSRRLDDDESFFTVDAADVTPCEYNEIVFYQVEVGLPYFLFQFFKHC